MEDLKQYKQVWKEQDHAGDQIDTNTIAEMIYKKSSSIVKWIFYISIIELSFFILLDIFTGLNWTKTGNNEMYIFNLIVSGLTYLIPIIFIYLFYKNYQSISATNSIKGLIKSIIKTRRTVKHYIIANIALLVIGFLIATFILFQEPEYIDLLESITENYQINGSLILWILALILILIAVGFLLLIYQVLYGILLKRLKENYKELLRN